MSVSKSSIEWCDSTWSPVTGCDKVSAGCDNCYAETIAHRFAGTPQFPNGFGVTLRPERLDQPLRWRRPRRIFVNSMSDLFHDAVPDEYIAKVWAVMALAPQHTFQVLTKRHGRMRSLLSNDDGWFGHMVAAAASDLCGEPPFEPCPTFHSVRESWPLPNVWLGVSTENQQWADIRIPALLDTPAAVRFISAEPLLGYVDLYRFPVGQNEKVLHWVIVGGESGRGARPMHPRWAEQLHRQCEAAGVSFLFKQWGEWTPMAPVDAQGRFDFSGSHAMTSDGNLYGPGDLTWPDGPRVGESYRRDFPHHHPTAMYRVGKKAAGRELYHDGRTWDQYPAAVTHA